MKRGDATKSGNRRHPHVGSEQRQIERPTGPCLSLCKSLERSETESDRDDYGEKHHGASRTGRSFFGLAAKAASLFKPT